MLMLRPWGCCSWASADCAPPLSSRFRGFILLLTFLIYACYHMSRKPISIVKVRLVTKGQCQDMLGLADVCCNWMLQTSDNHLPNSFTLVIGTALSTWQTPIAGGSSAMAPAMFSYPFPLSLPSRQHCCLVWVS